MCAHRRNMYSHLHLIHEQQGTFAQLQLLLKALKVDFEYDKPLEETLANIENYAHRILSMGPLSDDHIICMLILNAMANNFGPLQHLITSLSSPSTLTSLVLGNRIHDEAAFIRRHTEAGLPPNPYLSMPLSSSSSAFATISFHQQNIISLKQLNCLILPLFPLDFTFFKTVS